MIKKFFTLCSSVVFVFLFAGIVKADNMESVVDISVLDIETNEQVISDVEIRETFNSSTFLTINSEQTKEYELEFRLPKKEKSQVQLFNSQTNTNDDGSVKATVKINYFWSGNNIRISGGSCSWTPDQYILITNRNFFLTDGHSTMSRTPNSNSASYVTTWGYVAKLGGNAAPNVQSQATVTAPGMGGGYRIFASVFL